MNPFLTFKFSWTPNLYKHINTTTHKHSYASINYIKFKFDIFNFDKKRREKESLSTI